MSLWMSVTERTVAEQVPAPPDVRAFLRGPRQHPARPPARRLGAPTARSETADGYVQTYRVRDRIPLGPFTLRTSYVARLYVPVSGDVIAEARQFPSVRLHTVVSFDQIDGGTRIAERIRIRAPRLLSALTVREAVKAHTEMLSNIRCRFA